MDETLQECEKGGLKRSKMGRGLIVDETTQKYKGNGPLSSYSYPSFLGSLQLKPHTRFTSFDPPTIPFSYISLTSKTTPLLLHHSPPPQHNYPPLTPLLDRITLHCPQNDVRVLR